jgi:hypothetical protein
MKPLTQIRYPLMKIPNNYFWQSDYDKELYEKMDSNSSEGVFFIFYSFVSNLFTGLKNPVNY